jgi:hypothetical protein
MWSARMIDDRTISTPLLPMPSITCRTKEVHADDVRLMKIPIAPSDEYRVSIGWAWSVDEHAVSTIKWAQAELQAVLRRRSTAPAAPQNRLH